MADLKYEKTCQTTDVKGRDQKARVACEIFTEEEILWIFDVSGLVVDMRSLDLSHFRNTLYDLLIRRPAQADHGAGGV